MHNATVKINVNIFTKVDTAVLTYDTIIQFVAFIFRFCL